MKQVFTRTRITATLMAAAFTIASCGGAAQPTGPTASTAAPAAAATAAPTVAAAPAQKGALVLMVDTVSGSIGTTDEEKAMYSCVQKNRFPQGEPIVWRVRVHDGLSGKVLDDKGLKSVELKLPDGKIQAMKFGPHPKGKTDDYFWTTSFKLPVDYPTGAFKYGVTATSLEGLVGEFSQFNVAASMLQVIKAGAR